MNPRAKGMRNELKAKKYLESIGWTVYRVPPSRAWQKNQDIFNLFDLFCCKSGYFKLIQIKTNQAPSFKPFREFKKDNYCADLSIEVWIWKDRKGWDKRIIK